MPLTPDTAAERRTPSAGRGGSRKEALTHGPDALHLAAVFGISERAAIRYANAAKAFLESSLEQNQ
ncbi:hypothetical protein AB0D71_19560 [Streptomyces avermitilis]|uniref:hypothetical protein n=1 Tax=Streptomyces avermitilis TaxID=33903 RepID=UPI0033ED65CA